MPQLAADPIVVSSAHGLVRRQLVRTHSTPQQLALRARIILEAAEGVGVRRSAKNLDVWPKTVRRWRERWREAPEKQSVAERLADAPRPGVPPTSSANGANARLPTRRCAAGLSRTSRSARWGVF